MYQTQFKNNPSKNKRRTTHLYDRDLLFLQPRYAYQFMRMNANQWGYTYPTKQLTHVPVKRDPQLQNLKKNGMGFYLTKDGVCAINLFFFESYKDGLSTVHRLQERFGKTVVKVVDHRKTCRYAFHATLFYRKERPFSREVFVFKRGGKESCLIDRVSQGLRFQLIGSERNGEKVYYEEKFHPLKIHCSKLPILKEEEWASFSEGLEKAGFKKLLKKIKKQ